MIRLRGAHFVFVAKLKPDPFGITNQKFELFRCYNFELLNIERHGMLSQSLSWLRRGFKQDYVGVGKWVMHLIYSKSMAGKQ